MINIFSDKSHKNNLYKKNIRSFVLRNSRIKKNQKDAISKYWPLMGINFQNEILKLEKIFVKNFDIILEIGFGMGLTLVEMARTRQNNNFIGIEVYKPGIGSCLRYAHELKIKNLRIINHDAVEVLSNMIPSESIYKIQLFFPDPWNKKKHNKRRIINLEFIKLLSSKLIFNGIIHIKTDSKEYKNYILKIINHATNVYKLKEITNNKKDKNKIISKFEMKAVKLKNKIYNFMYRKY